MNNVLINTLPVLLLFGCQTNTLDDSVDSKEALDMSFCESSGLASYHPASKQGQITTFRCKNGLSVQLPPQSLFESDEEYVTQYYDQFLLATALKCPSEGDNAHTFSIQHTKEVARYYIGCTLSGRSFIEAGHYRNTFEEQFETLYSLEDHCKSEERFKLLGIHKQRTNHYRYQFQCGQRFYTLTDQITIDDLEDVDALFCDYSGISSINAKVSNDITHLKQAELKCQNGFSSTVQF